MMVQGAAQGGTQMAGRAVNLLGDDDPHSQSASGGLRGDMNMGIVKTEGSLSSPGDEEDEDDDGEDDDDDDDDEEDGDGNASWKSLACLLCGKPSEELSEASEHNKDRDRDEPYLCVSCGQRFELIQHANAGEPQVDLGLDEDGEDTTTDVKPIVGLEEADGELGGRGSLECHECQVRFEDTASLERHAMTHVARGAGPGAGPGAEAEARPFQCGVCARGFNRKDKLKLHLMAHSGDKPLKCDVCGKAFLRRDHLNNHVKTHTRLRQPPARTRPPTQQQARRERPRSRGRGGQEDGVDADLAADGGKAAEVDRPYGCNVCHKAFSRKDNLAAHLRIHTGEKPFACDVCGKAFAERCALKRHMVVHTQEKLYPCRICGRAFARKGHLTEHAWLHDELKPFLCNVCGKAFARDRKLKSHMLTHSGERPYQCDVCKRAFARKDNLKSHMALHFGVRPGRAARTSPGSGTGVAAPDASAAAMPITDLVSAPGLGNVPDLMHGLGVHQGLHQDLHQDVHQQMLINQHQHHLMNPVAMGGVGVGVGAGLNLMPCPMQVALD